MNPFNIGDQVRFKSEYDKQTWYTAAIFTIIGYDYYFGETRYMLDKTYELITVKGIIQENRCMKHVLFLHKSAVDIRKDKIANLDDTN